jgi:hypothetical protein
VVAQRARRNAAADAGGTHGGGGTAVNHGDKEVAAWDNDVRVAAVRAKRTEVRCAIVATCKNTSVLGEA